jgi:hypothetical protein
MPVREMLQRIDSYELTEWISYLKLEERDMKRDAEEREAAQRGNAPKLPPGMAKYQEEWI